MDLLSIAKTFLSNNTIDIIAQQNDIEKWQAQDATQGALDILLGALTKNSSTKEGSESLDQALTQDHDGSLLESITTLLKWEKPSGISEKTINGEKILKHILNDKTDIAAESISKEVGIDKGKALSLLIKLAPIMLAMLGKIKKETWSDAQGISRILQETTKKEKWNNNKFINLATKILDQDGDGSMVDDLLWMAGKYFGK